MSTDSAQDQNWLLLHFQQLTKFDQSRAVFLLAHQIRHLENYRIQHRLGHSVDIGLFDLVRTGVGTDQLISPAKAVIVPPVMSMR